MPQINPNAPQELENNLMIETDTSEPTVVVYTIVSWRYLHLPIVATPFAIARFLLADVRLRVSAIISVFVP